MVTSWHIISPNPVLERINIISILRHIDRYNSFIQIKLLLYHLKIVYRVISFHRFFLSWSRSLEIFRWTALLYVLSRSVCFTLSAELLKSFHATNWPSHKRTGNLRYINRRLPSLKDFTFYIIIMICVFVKFLHELLSLIFSKKYYHKRPLLTKVAFILNIYLPLLGVEKLW